MPYVSAAQCIRVRRSRWIHTLERGAVLPSDRPRVFCACASAPRVFVRENVFARDGRDVCPCKMKHTATEIRSSYVSEGNGLFLEVIGIETVYDWYILRSRVVVNY